MTYCVGLMLDEGLVFLSDTRTNAGLDNISRYRKMFTWEVPGERAIVMLTAGNLAITQAVVSVLREAIDDPDTPEGDNLLTAPTMFRVAELVGEAMQSVQHKYQDTLEQRKESSGASIILGGQRAGGAQRLFLIYAAGNFIEATEDTPYLQIGEHKYGKPILDRVITQETPIEEGVKAALLSMDSTLRSNLSVGMPLDLAVLPEGKCAFSERRRIEAEDTGFKALSDAWSQALRKAFSDMPDEHCAPDC
ncbi:MULTISPECIES: proteasome-type protease [unclassified Thalassospira]|uniref:proteasome-type protease n=1 Tax=unclassified Thalassospira TaxID=2648997 RepID=UPI000A1F5B9C|nr:proteasome-type protease [Thalassospira sp. MCCC 1A01428]OSQ45893.1 peptidase [Thalassospira sp. MCCC 1A01428]